MSEHERNKYLEAYYNNEADANRNMGFANAVGAVYLLVIWIFYLTGFFKIHSDVTLILINVSFPIAIVILLTPLIYTFKFPKVLHKPNYKFFVLISFVFVIACINIILPKHTMIAWALCIVMTNHYYNPKVSIAIFAASIVMSLICMYASMFVGEFDPNVLLGNEVLEADLAMYKNGPVQRYELLHELLLQGYNRYLDVILNVFLPRAFLITLVFFVSFTLNRRTYKLLVSEISVNSEQEKARTELEVAKEIQLNTLPSEISTSEDIEIVAELKAAKEVGGDFYDYFKIDADHTAVVIGDISGKGVPAAFFMMKTITCFKNFVAPNKTPAEILKQVNKALYDNNKPQMFVTCFLAILNKKTGVLQFANAGHNPPIIGKNKDFKFLKCQTGFVLGGLEEAFVQDEEIQLKNGDTLMLYTDGVTEARNEEGDFYGEKRFLDLMNSKNFNCLIEMHHALKDDLEKFVQGADQSDDVTIMSLMYRGDKCYYVENRFDGKLENIEIGMKFVSDFCDKYEIDVNFKNNLLVVADELYSNIVKYGYQNNGGVVFTRLLFNKDKNEFVITLIDRAPAFNPLNVNNNPLEGDVEDQRIGGLGILIVKKIMTEYAYDYINKKNILVLRKKF